MKMKTRQPNVQNVMMFRPIDDLLFNLMYQDKDACQELIRTILGDDSLKVISVTAQDSIPNLVGRGVRLDVLCETADGKQINVEVQRMDSDDHYRRIRYNASAITARHTSKGTDFRDVVEVYVIYITEFDLFDTDKTVCNIDSVIRETGKVIDDGLHRIIVNAKINDGTKTARLMTHFRENDFSDNEFPEASKQIRYYKHTEEGSKQMSSIMSKMMQEYAEEYAKEYAEEYAKEYAEEYANERIEYRDAEQLIENVNMLSKRFNVTTAEACTFLNKTIADYEKAAELLTKFNEKKTVPEPVF